jgi:hypothetical protein
LIRVEAERLPDVARHRLVVAAPRRAAPLRGGGERVGAVEELVDGLDDGGRAGLDHADEQAHQVRGHPLLVEAERRGRAELQEAREDVVPPRVGGELRPASRDQLGDVAPHLPAGGEVRLVDRRIVLEVVEHVVLRRPRPARQGLGSGPGKPK